MSAPGPVPAGWYPDPTGSPCLREWDGKAWTSDTRPFPPPGGHRTTVEGTRSSVDPSVPSSNLVSRTTRGSATIAPRQGGQKVEAALRMAPMSPAHSSNLLATERVVGRGELHWWSAYGSPILFGGFGLVFLAWFLVLGVGSAAVLFALLFGVPAAIALCAGWLRYNSAELVVTSQRVAIKDGVLNRTSHEILLTKVESVGVKTGLLGGLIGFGTVIIGGTGGTKETFAGVKDSQAVRRLIQEQVAALRG